VSLAHNKLTELPENLFSSQTRLVEIDLSHNHLTKFDLGTVRFTTKFERINLAHNNMQSLRNLLSTSFIHQNKIIDVTENKWNCMYTQILEEIASKHKYELIGNIFNCSMSWLNTTNDKLKIQHDNIASLDKRFNSTQKKYDNDNAELRKLLVEHGKNYTDLKLKKKQKIVK
jgi:Leucine rich repeat